MIPWTRFSNPAARTKGSVATPATVEVGDEVELKVERQVLYESSGGSLRQSTKVLRVTSVRPGVPAPFALVAKAGQLPYRWQGHKLQRPRETYEVIEARFLDRPKHSNPMPSKSTLDRAVREMQVYLGSVDYAPVRAQQKLQDRVRRSITKIEAQTGTLSPSVWDQLEASARSRGVVRPTPGKDY